MTFLDYNLEPQVFHRFEKAAAGPEWFGKYRLDKYKRQ